LIVGAVVLVGGGIGGYSYWRYAKSEKIHYSTVDLKRGDITYGITATGNLNDSLVINVGTQVSGIITQIFVDFNDSVRPREVIAMIDTIPLATQVTDAVAALYKARTTLVQQKKEFARYKELLARKAVDQSDYDIQEASYDGAVSTVQGAEADLKRAKMNLGYATITAPIRGIIINRNVTIGQTVAASFATPTLFAIGNDPHIMQVTASIDEADIGWVKPGQDVDFTVETYPDRVYHGTVFQVRLQSIMNQNVVTYNVMINLVNEDLSLIPGMTATLTIKVAEHKDVLVVPMTALLFNPNASDTLVPSADHNKQTIWVICDSASNAGSNGRCADMKGTMMYCDTVKRILDDGVMAEIEGKDLHEGMKIATGIVKEQSQKLKSIIPTTTQQKAPTTTTPKPAGK
jgi:HlyD family secretion protein